MSHGIFAQKIQGDGAWSFDFNMLDTQRASSHGVGLVLVLFTSNTKSQAVNNPRGRGNLRIKHTLTYAHVEGKWGRDA